MLYCHLKFIGHIAGADHYIFPDAVGLMMCRVGIHIGKVMLRVQHGKLCAQHRVFTGLHAHPAVIILLAQHGLMAVFNAVIERFAAAHHGFDGV